MSTDDEYLAESIERLAAAIRDGDADAVTAAIDQTELDGYPELAATMRGQVHDHGVDALIAMGGGR